VSPAPDRRSYARGRWRPRRRGGRADRVVLFSGAAVPGWPHNGMAAQRL